MEFICSLTGKSPSTTGAGTEGALTKGPFNALPATTDLNNALLSYILTGYQAFSTAAGHIGSKYKVEHDISLLVPEIWCRMQENERQPKTLIENKFLEKIEDFEYNGKTIRASRLGYRITNEFCIRYLGRIFDSPNSLFPQDMLKPELQSKKEYADGINNIVETQERVAGSYITDGSVNAAIPPLKALIYIMAEGTYEGMDETSPEFRRLFDRENVVNTDWYRERLERKIQLETTLMNQHLDYLSGISKTMVRDPLNICDIEEINGRISWVKSELEKLQRDNSWKGLVGTLGADLLCRHQ